MAIKPKDLKFEEAALRKRLEFVKSIKAALKEEESITAQTVEAYTSIIDGTLRKKRSLHPFYASYFAHFADLSLLQTIFSLCLADIIKEVAQEVHRAVKTGVVSICLHFIPQRRFNTFSMLV